MVARASVLVLIVFTMFFSSCSDKTITNNYNTSSSSNGQVYGRVSPAEAGTEVSLWQEKKIYSTRTDAEGYFVLKEIAPSLYVLRVAAPSGAHRLLASVEVRREGSASLGVLQTSLLPEPLFSMAPEGDGVPISAGYGNFPTIQIASERALDLASIVSSTRIEPGLPGQWVQGSPGWESSGGLFWYAFRSTAVLKASTEYVVTIGSSLRPEDGEAWGQTHVHRFTTEPFRMISLAWSLPSGPGQPVSPGYRGDLVYCTFNNNFDAETLEEGITLQPPAPLEISRQYDERRVRVGLRGGLAPGTNYTLSIGPPLADIFGAPLDSVTRVAFRSESFALTQRSPSQYLDEMPLRGFGEFLFEDLYNIPIDLESARSAIRIEPECSFRVDPSYSDEGYRVTLLSDLSPATAYTVTIGPELASTDGVIFGTSQAIQFRSEPLKLAYVQIANGPHGGEPGELDPSGELYVRAYLNAAVSPDSFARAASFDPEIAGVWLSVDNPGNPGVQYLTTQPLALEPGRLYVLTILGSVPLVGNARLGADVVRTFRVSPIRVEDYSPSNGSTGVYLGSDVVIRFNVRMNLSATQAAFSLRPVGGAFVEGSFSWFNLDREMRFAPEGALQPMTTYEAVLTRNAIDAGGRPIEAGVSFFFRTASQGRNAPAVE